MPGAIAPIEVIEAAVAGFAAIEWTEEQLAFFKCGPKIGWRNFGKVTKGWSADEIKAGKKLPVGVPPVQPVVTVRKAATRSKKTKKV